MLKQVDGDKQKSNDHDDLYDRVHANIEESRRAREASNFKTYIGNEKRVEHRHQQNDKVYYGHNVYDESFRTPEADEVGKKVLDAMNGVVSNRYAKTVNVMIHKNGTVSVGLSGDLDIPETLERIQAVQQAFG